LRVGSRAAAAAVATVAAAMAAAAAAGGSGQGRGPGWVGGAELSGGGTGDTRGGAEGIAGDGGRVAPVRTLPQLRPSQGPLCPYLAPVGWRRDPRCVSPTGRASGAALTVAGAASYRPPHRQPAPLVRVGGGTPSSSPVSVRLDLLPAGSGTLPSRWPIVIDLVIGDLGSAPIGTAHAKSSKLISSLRRYCFLNDTSPYEQKPMVQPLKLFNHRPSKLLQNPGMHVVQSKCPIDGSARQLFQSMTESSLPSEMKTNQKRWINVM